MSLTDRDTGAEAKWQVSHAGVGAPQVTKHVSLPINGVPENVQMV